MRLYREVEEKGYAWTLFFLLNNLSWEEDKDKEEIKDLGGGMTLKVRLSTGLGLSKKEEMDRLSDCRYLRVYTDEVELSIMTSDKFLYRYTPRKEGNVPVKGLDVVGNYVFISPEEVCSPVFVKSGQYVACPYFKNLSEYALNDKTEAEGFEISFKDNKFSVSFSDENMSEPITVLEIDGIGKNATYGFVYYILSGIKIDSGTVTSEDFDVRKIEKVWSA